MLILLGETLVNVDHIREIKLRRGTESTDVRVTFVNGDESHYEAPPNFDPIEMEATIVPAPPDYHRVTYSPPDDLAPNGSTWTDPIIAFAVTRRDVRPICLDGITADDPFDDYAILRPDGKVDAIGDQIFDDVEEYRGKMDKRYSSKHST